MDIRCRAGLHKWTVYNKYLRRSTHDIKYTELHCGCRNCGKMKVIKQRGWQ